MAFQYKVERGCRFPYKVYDDQNWDKDIVSEFMYEVDAAKYCRWRNSEAGKSFHDDGRSERW